MREMVAKAESGVLKAAGFGKVPLREDWIFG